MPAAVVVGGGLAGLVTARHLASQGVEVTLFERDGEVGGRVASRREDGFVLDRGFQVLFEAYPAVKRELDLAALDLRRFDPGATIARPGERATLVDPFRDPTQLVETLLTRTVTLRDKVGVAKLRRRLRGRSYGEILQGGGESIATHLEELGFSRAFREGFAAPLYGGITLDRTLETDRLVFEYTFKAMSEGAIGVPAAGMGAIPAQLRERAERAGARIETDTPVEGLEASGDHVTVTVDGETLQAEAAVVATDPPTAAELTGVETIPTEGRGCVTQHVALPGGAPPTGRRLHLNATEQGPNTVAPMSAVAPEYADDDRTLFAATFLGAPDATDEALFAAVQETMASWYPEANLAGLKLIATDRIPFAQFDQSPGFRERLPAPDAPDGEVYLAGDYTRWSSIQGALESGRVAAERVLAG